MCLTAFIFKSHCHIMTDKVVAKHTSVVETIYEAGTQFSTSLKIVGQEFYVKIVPKVGYLIVVLEKTSSGTSSVRTQTYTVKDGIESKKNQKNFRIKESRVSSTFVNDELPRREAHNRRSTGVDRVQLLRHNACPVQFKMVPESHIGTKARGAPL